MIAYNLTENQAKEAAKRIGAEIREWRDVTKNSHRFRLDLGPDRRWQRLSGSGTGRKVHAVCWHGHEKFFRELFKIAPDARIQTAQTRGFARGQRFYTKENFERVFWETDRNIGSMMSPMSYSDACNHDERGVWEV